MATITQPGDHTGEDAVTSHVNSHKLDGAEIICVIGAPGVGKGTQCKKLVEDFNAVHVSVGDLLRDKADKLLADDGIDLDEYMRNSILVPKEITQKYLETHLINHVRGGKRRFLVDGFPRSMDQALYFKSCGIKIKAVLYFKSTKDKALSRMQNRAMTSDRIRVDDTYAIFQERYKGFLGEIHAIEEYYEQQGKLWEVDCEGSLLKIYKQLVKQVMRITGEWPRSMASLTDQTVELVFKWASLSGISSLWPFSLVLNWFRGPQSGA